MARRRGWDVVLRIEDLETPRIKPGVIDLTINLLAWLGINWDRGPFVQSLDPAPHLAAMDHLGVSGLVYPCELSRSQIEAAAGAPQEGSAAQAFPHDLRPDARPPFTDTASSWRFAAPGGVVSFHDVFKGPQHFDSGTLGDFVVWTRRRSDAPGQPAYQLAVVVDDARQGVTEVVRGDDLLDSAARQLSLYNALGLTPLPTYCHLPLVRGSDGKRLAKRHGDSRLDTYRALGATRERVIGLVAHWCGVLPTPRPLSPAEFLAGFSLDTLPRTDITFTPEHHAWLLDQ